MSKIEKSYSTSSLHRVAELRIQEIRRLSDNDGNTFWVRDLVIKMEGGTHHLSLFADNPDSLTISPVKVMEGSK